MGVADVVLHCGLSSGETGDPPYAEGYDVPAATAQAVRATQLAGGRVVAVGTTVIRALAASAADSGSPQAGGDWTDLVITPQHDLRSVDALLTGWHQP